MARFANRREFLRDFGLGAAALPFVLNLPSLGFAGTGVRKQRLVVMFSPNGIVPKNFWPDAEGDNFAFKPIMAPLEQLKSRTMVLNGVCDKVRGDGDNHMRHGLPADGSGTVPRQYPGGLAHARRVVERDLD